MCETTSSHQTSRNINTVSFKRCHKYTQIASFHMIRNKTFPVTWLQAARLRVQVKKADQAQRWTRCHCNEQRWEQYTFVDSQIWICSFADTSERSFLAYLPARNHFLWNLPIFPAKLQILMKPKSLNSQLLVFSLGKGRSVETWQFNHWAVTSKLVKDQARRFSASLCFHRKIPDVTSRYLATVGAGPKTQL